MSQRVFVTGATGYLGSAIAARLARAGHTVYGLTRNAKRAGALESAGVHPVIGDLGKPDGILGAIKNCDAVVHAAAEDSENRVANDQRALEAIRTSAQDGRVRRVLYTSGVWVYGDTGKRVVDESSELDALDLVKWRPAHEEIALDLSVQEVQAVIIRPGMVYGESRGVLGDWFTQARERSVIQYPGDGSQHWTMVHRDDVAEAYKLALEHAGGGERYLLTDESQYTVRELAEAAAAAAGATAKPWPAEDVLKQLGLFGEALLADQRATSAKARRDLGWVPRHTSFVKEAAGLYRDWQGSKEATVA